MGRLLSDLGEQPDSVVTSTALRARATAELAATAGAWTCPLRLAEDLYLPVPGVLLAQARAEKPEVKRLVLVGHEPAWSEAAARFAGGGQVRMVTAALARLDFSVTDWSRIDFGQATLVWMVTPKLLEAGAS
jgi:phosphohistidine phosphatase